MFRAKTVALLVLLLAVANARGAARKIALLKTGSFHGNEVSFEARGEWYALVPEARGASLRRVTVSVVAEVDELVDLDGQSTGKLVETMPAVKAVALVRGLDELRAGPVVTAVMLKQMEVGKTVEARLGERKYTFRLACRRADPGVDAPGRTEVDERGSCAATLISAATETPLFTYSAQQGERGEGWLSDEVPEIVWAGDLDRDGGLDVLLDTSDHYNEREITLYLSSAAAKGALVRRVTSFRQVGC